MALDEKQRPDQIVCGENVLPHQPSRPLGLAVAPGPDREVEGRGGNRGLRSRRIAHFDRSPEFNRHFPVSPSAARSKLYHCASATSRRRWPGRVRLILAEGEVMSARDGGVFTL